MLIYSISNQVELKAVPSWAEWLELRVDLAPNLVDYLPDLSEYKLIITDRWKGEGGKSERSRAEKLSFYQALSHYSNLYFDVEIELIEDFEEIVLESKRIILSYHNYHTLNITFLSELLEKAQRFKPAFIKLSQYCSSFAEVVKLYHLIHDQQEKLLWVVMGDYGKLQRLLHPYLDSVGTFITSTGAETVSGQLNVSDVENNQHLLASKPFKWGGLIGGEQVYTSLGLEFYNKKFRDNNLTACYLPISLKKSDLSAFFELIESNPSLQQNCYGFSLTMPFKEEIPQLFKHSGISNLLIYDSEPHFYNTDYDAFSKVKQRLASLPINTVLVYGTGSMAEMAVRMFDNYQVFQTGRDKNKLEKLKDKRNKREIIDQISPEIYFDLVINCSPLGMKGESFSRETGISNFRFVIDLPYSLGEIPLQREVEVGSYISGREFWVYQSERQLQLFKERIEND